MLTINAKILIRSKDQKVVPRQHTRNVHGQFINILVI